jgi:hypothetical protein
LGGLPPLINIVLLNIVQITHIFKEPQILTLRIHLMKEMRINWVWVAIRRNLILITREIVSWIAAKNKHRNSPGGTMISNSCSLAYKQTSWDSANERDLTP